MFPNLGPMEMMMVMGIAILLFGKRLPEVGRSLGKGIVEFKKGIRGIEDEFDISGTSSRASSRRSEERPRSSDYPETSVPKFEPPSGAPIPQMEYEPQSTPHD
jgi:sec-independent protein translocase protein TatA